MAAGKGTRLKSKRPKVLHEIGGRALLLHVIAAAKQVVAAENIYCIIGHEADRVRADQHAGDQEADDRRQLQTVERDGDADAQGEQLRQFEQGLLEFVHAP